MRQIVIFRVCMYTIIYHRNNNWYLAFQAVCINLTHQKNLSNTRWYIKQYQNTNSNVMFQTVENFIPKVVTLKLISEPTPGKNHLIANGQTVKRNLQDQMNCRDIKEFTPVKNRLNVNFVTNHLAELTI